MIISYEIAIDLWNNVFGKNVEETYDAFGRKITKKQYDSMFKEDVNTWVVDYVQPLHLSGSTHISNIIILHRDSADFKRMHTEGTMLGKYKIGKTYADADYQFEVKVIDTDGIGKKIGRLKTCYRSLQNSWSYSDWTYSYYNCSDELWFEIILKGLKRTFLPSKNSLRKVFSSHKDWTSSDDITSTIKLLVEEETAELEINKK